MSGSLHKVLVVGAGSIGERHLRCFQATQRCEVLFAEINESLRHTVAKRYGAQGFVEVESALRESPDAAVIATPAHLHVELAIELAEAGLHLLIEKPLGTDTNGVQVLRKAVRKKQILAGVAYVYRSHPVLADMRQAIVGGRFGKPVELVVVSGQHFPTYRPAYREIYYRDRAMGGGAIQDALTHLINAAEWLVGPVTRLVADAAHHVLPGVEVEDTVHLLARHGEVLASYSLNQHQAPNETTVSVICEGGTARFEAHENRWRWMSSPGNEWQSGISQQLARDELFILQAHHFLDAVEAKCALRCSLEDGLQTLRVNLAALKSAAQGTWQTISTENDS